MEKFQGSTLISGATGFIGRRLTQRLLDEGFSVRCMVRRTVSAMPDGAEIVQADMLEPATLVKALAGIDTAYYLVHSMAGGRAGFERRDREAAENFVAAANRANVRRVIYLGGLGETGGDLSEHLKSRLAVADILKKGTFATTFLRAAVIIGAGGASFEMIRALVKHLPVMITPRWVMTRCQPIEVGDVIDYLAGCLIDERTCGRTFDIGGPEVLTYREMMERMARIQGKKLYILPVPVLTPKLSSYWVGFITPVPASVSMPLIEGLKNEVVCRDNAIRDIIPLQLKPYDEAVRSALKGDDQMQQPPRFISKLKTFCHRFGCIFCLLLVLNFALPAPSHALTVESILFADSTTIGGKPVPLRNAALLRYLKFIKAYVAAIYLPDRVKAEDVLSDMPKRLEISYLVSIKGPDFNKGAAPVLERNQTPAELAKLQRRIDRINAAYKDVKSGDRYSLTYLPGLGTELALNGTPLIVIEGADFAAAYFGIWLGREPIDEKLKRDLLKGR